MTDTETAEPVPGDWRDARFAQAWQSQDRHKDLLDLPRRLTAALTVDDLPDEPVVLDIGSGPGAYLDVLLTELPTARGIWTDSSEPMLELARTSLAGYGDRVTYQLVDMRALAATELPAVDLVVSSRAAHHLSRPHLVAFYRACAEKLAPGGWLANLDHTEPTPSWNARYKAVRRRARVEPKTDAGLPAHRHDQPRPTIAENLEALGEAGFLEAELVWKAYHTCLFMARTPA
jgi:trans-aconitate methyltransferase